MSAAEPSKTVGHKVHEAAERAKEDIDSAAHATKETIRGGAELFKADVEEVKDAVSKQVHHDAAEAERRRRENELAAKEHIAEVTKKLNEKAQAEVDSVKKDAK